MDVSRFLPKGPVDAATFDAKDAALAARMHKAIAVILFKLEGQIILRNPEFGMDDRLLLDKIDYANRTVRIGGADYPLRDTELPTVDRANPYALSPEEERVMAQLKAAFLSSEKLQRHARFLYTKGGLYKCYNGNLLYHGCIPMNDDSSFMEFSIGCEKLAGRAFFDHAEALAGRAITPPRARPKNSRARTFCGSSGVGATPPSSGGTISPPLSGRSSPMRRRGWSAKTPITPTTTTRTSASASCGSSAWRAPTATS